MLMSSVHAEIRDNQYWSKIFSIFTGRNRILGTGTTSTSSVGPGYRLYFQDTQILLIISHAIDKETF